MILELYKELLKEKNSNAEIIEIYKTGSQIFRENPHDLDYVAICRNYTDLYSRTHKKIDGQIYDMIIKDESEIKKSLNFDGSDKEDGFETSFLYNYFTPIRETIYGQ